MSEYNEFVQKSFSFTEKPTLPYPELGIDEKNLPTILLGLGGETGEVLEIFKKSIRSNQKLDAEKIENLKLELGDVLWHIHAIAVFYSIPIEEIEQANISKLKSRNGKINF